jgi:hypothetical protein
MNQISKDKSEDGIDDMKNKNGDLSLDTFDKRLSSISNGGNNSNTNKKMFFKRNNNTFICNCMCMGCQSVH